MTYDILGIGGPVLDQLLPVSEEYLSTIPGEKGGMEPVDFVTLEQIIAKSGSKTVSVPGGSTRNTLHGLVKLGKRCALVGMVGNDSRGNKYRELLKGQNILPLLVESETPTAIVLSLVTPDGERTMRTFQGASIEIRGEHLDRKVFEKAKLVHLEGYTLYNEDLAETAMRLAKESGAKVSFDLASFEIVKKFREKVLALLDAYVDVIFANEEEVMALTGLEGASVNCDFLGELCEVGIVLMGPRGCWVKRDGFKKHYPAYPVQPLDTTGAGDLFASGFLYGYLRDESLEMCAHYGAVAGRAVVQVVGPIVPENAWEEIYSRLNAAPALL